MPETPDLTLLINRAASGDAEAARQVFPAVYRELRGIASARLAGLPRGGTLQTTALVHEAYLRVAERSPDGWQSAAHFYFAAARAMRDILVEEARRKTAAKRGGGVKALPFDDEAPWAFEATPDAVLALDAALQKLEREDPDGHRFVMLRTYAGLTIDEIAPLLGASSRTAERKWRFLRAWLARELDAPDPFRALR